MENNQEARTGGKRQNFWKKIYRVKLVGRPFVGISIIRTKNANRKPAFLGL